MTSETSLVEKGNLCLVAASEVLQDFELGRVDLSDNKLKLIEKDAVILAKEADKLALQLEAVDKVYQQKDDELFHQIGKLGIQENEEKQKKMNAEATLRGQQSILQDKESQLCSAESNLQTAERKLREAIKEEKNIQVGATIGGALLGLFTGGAGFLVGAAAGAGIGALVNACRDEEKDARSARNRRRNDVSQAKSAVQSSHSEISSHESLIQILASKIKTLELQRQSLHDKRSEIKAAIPILKKATHFWLLFKQLSEQAENRTLLLKQIISDANEEESYEIFRSGGGQRVATSFIESWKTIAVYATDGSSGMFSIEYNCGECRNVCSALPHVFGEKLVCRTCSLALTQ